MSLKMVLSSFLSLLEKIENRRKLNEDTYDLEFQKLKVLTENLKHNPEYSCKHGAQEINRCKNRYKDILPYDYTRVILTEDCDKPGSDYTNANYIKGASGSAAYIACQGPLPHTVVDFWRMIWECEVKVVIMACNEKESGKQKCENYWPEDEAKDYGSFHVELMKTQYICSDFLVRILKVFYEEEERMVYQFHYTTWPDHGVPSAVEPLLHLIQLVRKFQASDSVPMLVHCSAGCGRTGTICAIDYVWRLMISGRLKEPFNLYEIISRMRQQRIAMVQTKEQYILVHRAVAALFEKQLELIATHFYENINEDGHPLFAQYLEEEDHIYEEVNCESQHSNFSGETAECIEKPQHEMTISDDQENVCTKSINNESHILRNEGNDVCNSDITAFSQPPISSAENSCAVATINNINGQLKNVSEHSINNNTEQNVNFTLSLPLSAVKQKSKNLPVLENDDQDRDFVVENCVSCSVKIDCEGKVQILQQKEKNFLQQSSPCLFSSSPTNCEKETNSYSIENLHFSDNDVVQCQNAKNSKILPVKCSLQKYECDNGTFMCQSERSDVKEKHADIEEIFQKILNNNQTQTCSEPVASKKQFNLMKISDNLEDISKIDKFSVAKTSRTEVNNIKCETIESSPNGSILSAKHNKESKIDQDAVSDETCNDIVLHNLTSDCTQASRKRYISLVTECEQSFSEIERLLEEKNKTLQSENTQNKESSNNFPEMGNFGSTSQIFCCNKLYNVTSSDKSCTPQNKKHVFVSDNDIKSLKISESELLQDTSLNLDDIYKHPEKEVVSTVSHNNLHIDDNSFVNKCNIISEDTKQKCFGIEKALNMNQADESLEYIDSTITDQDTYIETDITNKQMKQSLPEIEISNFSLKSARNNEIEEKASTLRSKINDATAPDIKILKCNVRTEICRKEGTAHKRTGKVFEHEEMFPRFDQSKSSNVNFSVDYEKNNILNFQYKEDSNTLKEDEMNPIVLSYIIDKENSQPNSQAVSTHYTYNCANTSEDMVNHASETSGIKATVTRRPSIAKLKALFEKTVPTDSYKQHHERCPLSRSQSHHIHRERSTDKETIKEKYSTKPKLLNKMAKIFQSPSVENNSDRAYNNRLNVQWKSSDMEAISFTVESEQVPKPLVSAKENENRSEFLDNRKNLIISNEKIPNCLLPSDNTKDGICNKVEKCDDKEGVLENSLVGCLDFSSLMSVVTKEQNINKTQWYEHKNDNQGNETLLLDKKGVCNEEKEQQYSIDRGNLPCMLSEMSNAKNSLPPELPTKKKYQYESFCSHIKDDDYTDDNMQNLLHNSMTSKTKWYYENNENNSIGCESQNVSFYDDKITYSGLEDSNTNKNTSTAPDENKAMADSLQESITSQTSGHCEVNIAQHYDLKPQLPPKKKSNDIEKVENTNWYCNEIKSIHNFVKNKDIQIKTTDFNPYVNVVKTKDGLLITNTDETDELPNNTTQLKPDLYTNINTTSLKNIEQIENSLQQHPRGAIIDLTSRQSYASEQQSDVIKSIKYGSDPKLSETVITSDLEESHYNNEKPICDNLTKKAPFKLWENKCDTGGLTEKNKAKKYYEIIWPKKETGEQTINITSLNKNSAYNEGTQTDVKLESLLHNSSLDLKNSDIKHTPLPKPRSPALDKILSKSKSSSALFSKMRDKNLISNDNSKFKDISVNKVVCELNSILNVLTTRPFKSTQKEISSSSEKSSDTEMPQNKQTNLNQPLAPPRRKPRCDAVNCETPISDLELQGPYAPVIKSFKLPEKPVITKAYVKPDIYHLSKSATMSDINKAKFVDSKKINIPHSKENCTKTSNFIEPQSAENSGRLHSVYENVDCVQSSTVSLENDMKDVSQAPSGKMNKLKHSSSDASVFSVLRKTKCLNKDKMLTNQKGQQHFPHPVFKSETKSYTKRQAPIVNKQIITPMTDVAEGTVKIQQNNPVQNKHQPISCAKKTERRSMDDMDVFPVAPPRTRRHGPTPQKNLAEMEKFTSSLDEGMKHLKPQPLTRSTVIKVSENMQSQKLPSS